MQPAVFIAGLTGPLLVVIGVVVLLNKANAAMHRVIEHLFNLYLADISTPLSGTSFVETPKICPPENCRLRVVRYSTDQRFRVGRHSRKDAGMAMRRVRQSQPTGEILPADFLQMQQRVAKHTIFGCGLR